MLSEQANRDEFRAAAEHVSPDVEAMARRVTSTARRQRTRRTAVLASAAAVAAVAGVVWAAGSLGWLIGQDDVQPIKQPVEPPVEWRVDPDGDWVRVEDATFDGVNFLSKVVDVGGRLVAVGRGQTPIVTSTDGVDWTPADVPAAELKYLITGGPGVIAAGSTMDGDPVLWTSPDGLTWTQVDDPAELLSNPDSGISAVRVGGKGFESALGREPTTWISTDGRTWMPIDATDDSVAIDDLTTGGPGLVAVGLADLTGEAWGSPAQPAEEGMHTAAVWTSIDGRTWSRVPHDPGVFSPEPWVEMNLVTAGASGLVAIGNADSGVGQGRTLVWTSDDGESWTRVLDELDVGLYDTDAVVAEVVDTGREYLAIGHSFPDAGLWTSADGRSWEPIENDSFAIPGPQGPVKFINDVIQTPRGLVAVGNTATDHSIDTHTAAVWVLEQE